MHRCNNPECGYEINWVGRYKICPKCGFVMHPVIRQKKEKTTIFTGKKGEPIEIDLEEDSGD